MAGGFTVEMLIDGLNENSALHGMVRTLLTPEMLKMITYIRGKVHGRVKETLGVTVSKHLQARLLELGLAGAGNKRIQALKVEGKDQSQVAKDNQLFYLELQQLDSDEEKRPWHHFPRVDTMYGELVWVSPMMSLQVLLDYNPGNRKKVVNAVMKYALDMLGGNWYQTVESIGIDYYGNLTNGQHRLFGNLVAAILAHDKGLPYTGCPLFCAWNADPAERGTIDSGEKRSEATKIDLIMPDNAINKTRRNKQLFAVCRAMMNGARDRNTPYSAAELEYFALKYYEIIDRVYEELRGPSRGKGIKRADVVAALVMASLWFGEDKITPFCNRLGHILFEGEDDPAYQLYNISQRARKLSGLSLYRKALSAIEHSLRGDRITRLRELDADWFQWGDNWEVPAVGNDKMSIAVSNGNIGR